MKKIDENFKEYASVCRVFETKNNPRIHNHADLMDFAKFHAESMAIGFADWVGKLSPTQKISVWSKDGSGKGIFLMDNEQLYKRYLDCLNAEEKEK